MSSDTPAKSKGLSLYADLLDPTNDSAPGTISSAPVVYKQPSNGDAPAQDESSAQKQQINAAALRFQPVRRPQIASQKTKSTPAKVIQPPIPAAAKASQPVAQAQLKSSIADWTADGEEDEYYIGANQRQRGGRKRRKKNKEQAPVAQDWDDIYDPSRPNNYEEYKNSDERLRELREWKDRLYAHRIARRTSPDSDSEDDARRPTMQFAPPPASFAAPPPPPPPPEPEEYKPPAPAFEVPYDDTGEDAYARRLRLSQPAPAGTAPQAPPASVQPPSSTVSRAPIRYNLPDAPKDIPRTDAELESALQEDQGAAEQPEDAPRSTRPGQKGFAQRLMSKYGWSKGMGLGANATGIITPLQAKVEKQKKRPDAEGGGFATPGGMGKIIGGKKKGGDSEGRFGAMSEVVVLKGMVDGMDLRYELAEGNLMEEIGQECGEKYGRVERVYIDQSAAGSVPVFIKFTSQLSALRAVNALEGRAFNGNTVVARFFDSEKFDGGVYS